MFDFLCDYFGKALIAPILKYADDKLICDRVQLESIKQTHGEFTIIVHSTDEQKYLDRLKMNLKNGKLHWCLNHAQMKYKEYRIMLRDIIKDLDIKLIRNLINIKDDNGINCFIISCLRGYGELVDFFITVGADVDGQIGFFTPLTAACQAGYLKTVEILLKGRSNIDGANTQGETPLYTACVGGYYSLVNFLIEKEADINKQNKYRRTPLYATCLMGHVAIVSLLVNKGKKNVFHNKDSLIAASLGVNDTIVEKLISNDCCVNTVDMNGKTALFIACEEGYIEIVKLLIENNADIYKVDSEGKTPLHAACCVGNNDLVSMLMSKDLDLNMFDLDLETPLHKACRKGSIDVISNLLAFGADINKTNRDVHTPAHIAKTEGNIVDVRILKALEETEIEQTEEQNVTPKNKNKVTSDLIQYGWTPLYEACINGDIDTVQLLIRNRADVNMKTDSDEMPLVAACQQGHGFLIQMLIDEGADVDEALCCAAHKGYDRTIKILLHKGGNIGYKGVNGKSLLSLACEQGSTKAVKFLLEKGADFREIDVKGKTLIHVACNTGSVDLVQILLDKGLDLIICDKNGRYPLAVSVNKGFYDLSKLLIKKRCPIATSEEDIKTAMVSVFESGNKELSKLLVANGYTANLSHFNDTVLYHAYRLGLGAIVEILRRNEPTLRVTYKYGYTPMILADIGGNDDLSESLQISIFDIKSSSLSNDSIGLVYPSNKEDQKSGKKHHDVRKNVINCSWSLREYEYLFQVCMYGKKNSHEFEKLLRGNLIDFFIKPGEPHESIWFKQTPLCLAIRRGHKEVVKSLIKHCVDVNLTFEEWTTEYGSFLSKTIQYGYTPLFAACQRKYYDLIDMLIDKGSNVNKALYDACREGYLNTAQFLIEKGANVNSISRYGHTALYGACLGGYSTIVKFLIDQGSVVDRQFKIIHVICSDEKTCIHPAYVCGNLNIVQLLIDRGAYVDSVDHFSRTLLHKASTKGNYELVKILIDKGGNVNASDMYGSTPLIECVTQNIGYNHEEHYLDSHMRNYNSYEDSGQLHADYPKQPYQYYGHFGSNNTRFTENHYKIIQLLIENGADINKADKRDRTPLSLCKKIKDMKLTEMLLPKKF